MLTLTLGDNIDDNRITEFWHRLLASLRKYGIQFQYVWMKEFTKRGRRHMHVILDRFVKRTLIEKLWRSATEQTSYRVRINHRPIRSAAGYVFKYVSKGLQNEKRYRHKERRYSFSRGFNYEKAAKSHEWGFELDFGAFLGESKTGLEGPLQDLHKTLYNYQRLNGVNRSMEVT